MSPALQRVNGEMAAGHRDAAQPQAECLRPGRPPDSGRRAPSERFPGEGDASQRPFSDTGESNLLVSELQTRSCSGAEPTGVPELTPSVSPRLAHSTVSRLGSRQPTGAGSRRLPAAAGSRTGYPQVGCPAVEMWKIDSFANSVKMRATSRFELLNLPAQGPSLLPASSTGRE